MNRFITTALVLGLSASFSGCSSKLEATAQATSSGFVSQIADEIIHPSLDFQAASSPQILADVATTVFVGEVIGVRGTREWVSKSLQATYLKTTVFEVRVLSSRKGDLKEGAVVLVEAMLSPKNSISALESRIKGSKVGVFSVAAKFESETDIFKGDFILEPNTRFFTTTGPQGFVISNPDDANLYWPVLNDIEQGTLADAMPGGSVIPKE